MSKNPVEVRIKKGTFYISSKEDRGEGWTRQEFTDPNNPEVTLVRYHKNLSVEGEVVYVGFQDDKFKGDVLSMLIKGDDETYSIKVPVFSSGRVEATDQYFNSFVGALDNVNKGDRVTMFINNRNEDKNGFLYKNVVVLDENKSLIRSNFSFSDVPSWEVTEKKNALGKVIKEYDPSAANEFYIDIAKKVVEKFEKKAETRTEERPKDENPKTEPKKQEEVEMTPDDLPF